MGYEEYTNIEEIEEIEDLKQKKERRRKLYITAVNSTVLYLLAYLFVYLFYYIITINRAADFGIKAKLYYHDIRLTNAPIDHGDLKLINWNVIDYTYKI